MNKEKVITPDNVNHPYHYEGSTSLECIDVMQLMVGDVGIVYFCLCNAFKYMWRYKNKNGLQDLQKAKWYLDHSSFANYDGCFPEDIILTRNRLCDLLNALQKKEGL